MLNKNEAMGAYIGAAVGDAYGAPFEFIPTEDMEYAKRQGFDNTARYYTGGVHDVASGEWTDDTAMARCIAKSYFLNNKIDDHTTMKMFADWADNGVLGTRDYCFDIGNTVSSAIRQWRTGKKSLPMEGTGEGNGGIMRLAPVVVFNSNNYYHAVEDAVQTSRLTHDNDICDLYAECLMDVIFRKGNVQGIVPYNMCTGDGNGHVEATFWNAVECIDKTDNFMDAINMAVMMGNDTDSTACVTGMIAGSLYGLESIPVELINGLVGAETLMEEAEELYNLGLTERQVH